MPLRGLGHSSSSPPARGRPWRLEAPAERTVRVFERPVLATLGCVSAASGGWELASALAVAAASAAMSDDALVIADGRAVGEESKAEDDDEDDADADVVEEFETATDDVENDQSAAMSLSLVRASRLCTARCRWRA